MARTDETAPATIEASEAVTDTTAPAATEPATEVTDITDGNTDGNTATAEESQHVSNQEAAESAEDTAAKEAAEAAALAESVKLAEANEATFKEALSAAIDGRDVNSGDIPEALNTAVLVAYRALTPAGKKAAKQTVKDGMGDALRKDADAGKAKAYMDLGDAFTTTRGTSEQGVAKETVDPTDAYVTLRLAHYFASELLPAPADLKADWADRMKAQVPTLKTGIAAIKEYQTALAAWNAETEHADGTTEPTLADDTADVLKLALKIASGGSTRTRAAKSSTGTGTPKAPRVASAFTGTRRSIAKHIAEWAASVPVGTVAKHGEVAKFASSEYPGADASSGAVTAFMDRGNFDAITGVSITAASTADGKKGIKRTA